MYFAAKGSAHTVSITVYANMYKDVLDSKDKLSEVVIESGTYLDGSGILKRANAKRARTSRPIKIDGECKVNAPVGFVMWAFLLDRDYNLLGTYSASWVSQIYLTRYSSNAKYLNVVFKTNDGRDIVSNDLSLLNDGVKIIPFDKSSYKIEEFKNSYYPFLMGVSTGTWKNRITILHISDCHAGNKMALNNVAESVFVGNDLNSDSALNLVVNTGDHTNGMTMEKSAFLSQMDTFVGKVVKSDVPVLQCLGNHDANDGFSDASNITNVPTPQELWTHAIAPISEKYSQIVFGGTNRHYSYIDVQNGGHTIRFIALDMIDHDAYEGSSIYKCQVNAVYSQAQIDWLCETALNVPDGYGIVICNHYPFAPRRNAGYSEEYPTLNDGYFAQSSTGNKADGWKMIPEIVQAWKNRTSISKTYYDTFGSQDIVADYDFSNVGQNATFICYLTGHTHSKNNFIVSEENDVSYNQLMLCEDSSGADGTALSKVRKRYGTICDNAFSCLAFDLDEKKIYRVSYGAYRKANTAVTQLVSVFDIPS